MLLNEKTRESIFAKYIKPRYLNELDIRSKPTAIIVGGPPGSGKTHFIQRQLPPEFVRINADLLRGFHPDYSKLLKLDERTASKLTQEDCNWWTEKLLEIIFASKSNFVIEGTMKDPNVALSTIDRAFRYRYGNIIVAVVATPPRVSRACTYLRYETEKNLAGVGRFVDSTTSNLSSRRVPDSLLAIVQSSVPKRIIIYSRRGNLIKAEGDTATYLNPEEVVEKYNSLVNRSIEPEENQYLRRVLETTMELALKRGAEHEYLKEIR